MNSSASGDDPELYDRAERNRKQQISTISTYEMSRREAEYSEEYHSSNLLFESYADDNDEVFEEYQETSSVTITQGPRTRRISDVIDSIGA